MKKAIVLYHKILSILIVFAGSFFITFIGGPNNETVTEKIIMYILFNSFTCVCFLIGPVVGFGLSRFIMFGGVLIPAYYVVNVIGIAFGDAETVIPFGFWCWSIFSVFNILTAKYYSDKEYDLFGHGIIH